MNPDNEPHAPSNGENDAPATSGVPMPVSQPVFLRLLWWSAIVTVVLMIAGAVIGFMVDGQPGLYGGLLGATGAGVFLGLTVGSMAFANRFHKSDLYLQLFFAIVLGSWALKLIVFIVAALLLRNQTWLNPQILFMAVVAGAIISLVIDVIVVTKTRIPIVDPSHGQSTGS